MSARPSYVCALFAIFMIAHCNNDSDNSTDSVYDESLSWTLHDEIESLVYVSWPQMAEGSVRIEYLLDDEWHPTPDFDVEAGSNQRLLAGIPYATEVPWRVVQENGDSLEGPTITTGALPSGVPAGLVTVSSENDWFQDGNYLLTSISENGGGWGAGGPYWTLIIDRKGRTVWANRTPLQNWTLFAQVAVTGDRILWDEATYWNLWDHGEESKVHSRYLDAEIGYVSTPGLHHAFVQLPDGTLAWGSQFHVVDEALVEKAPGQTDETIIWTVAQDWPGAYTSGYYKHCESNGLFYDQSKDSYLYSFYTNNSLVEVDREAGTSLWWAGEVADGYSFIPSDSQFAWQHGISYTDDGTLLVSTAAGNSTPVYEYAVDHDASTLTLIWSYDPEVHATTNGDAWRLENGNTLHLVGSASHIVEVDPEGNVVWRVEYTEDRLLGRGEFIESLYDLVSPD